MMAVMQQSNLKQSYWGDSWLLIITMVLIVFGLVMMTSASVEIADNNFGNGFYYLNKQLQFLVIGCFGAGIVMIIPIKLWRQSSLLLLILTIAMLALVLVPGIGRNVNGSTRWLNLGFMTLQASEPAKLFIVIFMAWFLSKNREMVCTTWKGFLMPFAFIVLPAFLLLKEPDFGAVVVLMIAIFGMMFLAGVKVYQFALLIIMAVGGAAGLILSSEYRLTRVKTFITAFSDPFNEDVVYGSGYQLAQALIGFGRGEWFGVGLGNSIQKMYFLPEAHTDFVLAIIAEELGLVTVIALMGLFLAFIFRAMIIARKNEKSGNYFAAYMSYGIAFLFMGQIVINTAVNVGLLPTKGLTLPFLSSGGSSLIICMVMVAMLMRIDMENYRDTLQDASPKKKRKAK